MNLGLFESICWHKALAFFLSGCFFTLGWALLVWYFKGGRKFAKGMYVTAEGIRELARRGVIPKGDGRVSIDRKKAGVCYRCNHLFPDVKEHIRIFHGGGDPK
jgi:hypothetical protein